MANDSRLIMLTITIEIFYIKYWNKYTYFVYFNSKKKSNFDSYIDSNMRQQYNTQYMWELGETKVL